MDVEPSTYRDLVRPAEAKMILVVVEGLSSLPAEPGGQTPLESAQTPHLDALARQGTCGLHEPIAPGVTPGRGASLLALLGYDPQEHAVGRGALLALGVGCELGAHDVAACGRFATVADDLTLLDRNGTRLTTAQAQALCDLLNAQVRLNGAECDVRAVGADRFLFVLRGSSLSGDVEDTDPQDTGRAAAEPRASSAAGRRTARMIGQFVAQARQTLQGQVSANMVLLSGFSKRPVLPAFQELDGLRTAAITRCPMGRGVSLLAGLTLLEASPGLAGLLDALNRHWSQYDLFFLHLTPAEEDAECATLERQVRWIEEVDASIPTVVAQGAEALVVTGDRTLLTPGGCASWHPVPVLLWSPRCRPDDVIRFGERSCAHGALGLRLRTADLLPLMLANTMRLHPYGA